MRFLIFIGGWTESVANGEEALLCGLWPGSFPGMQTKIEKRGDGFALRLPKELLDACGIGEEATVIVQNRMLIVAAPNWRPREGWNEALKGADATMTDEDEGTLAHWASLPEALERRKPEPHDTPDAVLREEPKP